jgi:hypothetical protein
MNRRSRKTLLANTFGTFGYISCLLLWGWTGIVYMPLLLENDTITRILLPPENSQVVAPPASTESSPVIAFIATGVTLAVIVLTIIVLLRAPMTIANTGKTVTTKAAGSALPLITHGKPLAPAKKKRLTVQLVKLVKLCIVLLPVFALLPGLLVELSLPFDVVILVSSVLALIAIFWFSVQYITAQLLAADPGLLV